MDSVNEARHSSLLETLQYCNEKNSVWTADTPFSDDFDIFKGHTDAIDAFKLKHLKIIVGYTIDKANKEQLLINDLLIVMPNIRTWASRPAINKPEIKGQASMPESKITVLQDSVLLSTAQNMKQILDDNPTIIDPIYVPAARQTLFYQHILDFAAVVQVPESQIDQRATATKSMIDEIKAAMAFRKDTFLDTAKRFRESDSEFYNGFKSSMKVDDNPTFKLACQGNITNNTTGDAIAGVLCYFPGLDKKANTGEKGNFLFKSLPAGEHLVIFTKFGYEPLQKTIAINTGERTDLIIKLIPKVFP